MATGSVQRYPGSVARVLGGDASYRRLPESSWKFGYQQHRALVIFGLLLTREIRRPK
jgi:hypothetical protein